LGEVTKADAEDLVGKELLGGLDLSPPEAGAAANQVIEGMGLAKRFGDAKALGHGVLDEDGLR
jgi:hypothetical protein